MKNGICSSQSLIRNSAAKFAGLRAAGFAGLKRRFATVDLAILADPDLTPASKIVYAVVVFLDWQAGGSGCRDGNVVIAALSGLAERQIRYSLSQLQDRGLIEVERLRRRRNATIRIVKEPTVLVAVSEKVPECSVCHTDKVKIKRSGECYACAGKRKTREAVSRAQRALGVAAQDHDIAAWITAEKALPRVRRALRVMRMEELPAASEATGWTAPEIKSA